MCGVELIGLWTQQAESHHVLGVSGGPRDGAEGKVASSKSDPVSESLF